MSRNALAAAVVLPLLVIALGIVRAERHLANSTRWTFDVQGYDPRDLLRGHYINYRLDLHEGAPIEACRENDDDCCLCLSAQGSGVPPKVQRATCTVAKQRCEGVLRTRYLTELQRYYIPENEAYKLERRFQEAAANRTAHLRVAVDDTGKPQVEALLIGGVPVEKRTP